jgi:TonB family protein
MRAQWMEEDGLDRGALRGPLGLSIASHAVFLCLVLFVHGQRPASSPAWLPSWLGYKGTGPDARQLDLLQENAVRFRIFQPAVGAAGATGSASRTRLETPQADTKSQPAPVAMPSDDGVHPARRAPRAVRDDTGDGGATTAEEDLAGAPALQPDVALSDDLTILKLVKPVYPERELAAGVSARVLVAIHVAPSGGIDELMVRQAVADPPGSTRAFELTALEALRQWRVRLPPGDAQQQGMWLTVPIEYTPMDAEFETLEPDVQPERAESPSS